MEQIAMMGLAFGMVVSGSFALIGLTVRYGKKLFEEMLK